MEYNKMAQRNVCFVWERRTRGMWHPDINNNNNNNALTEGDSGREANTYIGICCTQTMNSLSFEILMRLSKNTLSGKFDEFFSSSSCLPSIPYRTCGFLLRAHRTLCSSASSRFSVHRLWQELMWIKDTFNCAENLFHWSHLYISL